MSLTGGYSLLVFVLPAICFRVGIVLVFLVLSFGLFASQQTDSLSSAKYYERIDDERVRFFYDKFYFLVDKNCQFKEIEREGEYDFAKGVFVGKVRDYDEAGNLVLEGGYKDGLKEGIFRAYHASGSLKWEVNYHRDIPKDTVRFYYPDGMPYLEYHIANDELLLWSYWDQRGRQRVKNGNGRFEVISEIDGTYTPNGHRWIRRKGRVRDGKPDMMITYRYIHEDGMEYAAGYEEYSKGEFIRGEDFVTGNTFYTPQIPVLPRVWHARSEAMVSKRCTIDEHMGFTQYIAEKWQLALSIMVRALSDEEGNTQLYLVDEKQQGIRTDCEPNDLVLRSLSFVLEIDKKGEIRTVASEDNFDTPALADRMLEVVRATEYWVPSWEGDFIDDELTVELKVFAAPDVGFFILHDLAVVRVNGS